jgi:phospholipid/cholesterol/gamma-HCH transport system substrate-binding protein
MSERAIKALPLLILGAVVVVVAVIASGAGPERYTIRADFATAGGLRRNADVKIDGVPVGRVSELEITDQDTAMATLEIDAASGPLGEGVAANVRAANLLGEKYLDLDPGDRSRPVDPSAVVIPKSRTGAPVELDDLLNVFDGRTRAMLSVLINESGIALAGRGSKFNQMLVQLPPALDRTRQLVADLGAENRSLGRVVVKSDRFLESMAGERQALGRLVESAEGAFASTASRHAELGETVRQAPATIAQLRQSLLELQRTSAGLGPSAVALRAAAPSMTSLLRWSGSARTQRRSSGG